MTEPNTLADDAMRATQKLIADASLPDLIKHAQAAHDDMARRYFLKMTGGDTAQDKAEG